VSQAATSAGLPLRLRHADGRVVDTVAAAQRHRALQLWLLHRHTDALVELAAGTRAPGGGLAITTRRDPAHFLPGGARTGAGWLAALLDLAAGHAERPRRELFVGVAPRLEPRGTKAAVAHSRWLWVDVDGAQGLPALRAFLAERPAHLVIASGGSGGAHAYWRLERPLTACAAGPRGGAGVDWIGRANARLVHRLNAVPGVPAGADPACRDRGRLLRLAGTVNHKTGAHARVVWADLALAPYPPAALVGDLPEPPHRPPPPARRAGRAAGREDPYRRIAPADYFRVLAGIDVGPGRLVRCPSPAHEDRRASCAVGRDAAEGWYCHAGCGAAGGIYDLASVLLGGPTGRALRGPAFARARDLVLARYGHRPAAGAPRR